MRRQEANPNPTPAPTPKQVRHGLCGGKKLTLLGQSFGGFCILTYLSLFPAAIERALFTFGLAPVGRSATEVYGATYLRMQERNRRFYERYPQDVELVREIVASLHEAPLAMPLTLPLLPCPSYHAPLTMPITTNQAPLAMPRGGTLTPRRFLMLGLLLGSANGFESLHDLLEMAREMPQLQPTGGGDGGGGGAGGGGAGAGGGRQLPDNFLLAVEQAQQHFETNPLYWLLHESIYCDANAKDPAARGPSGWAAEKVQASLGDEWQYASNLEAGAPPVQLTGEMVYSWMAEDFAWLRSLKPAAEILAAKSDWGPLYDPAVLGGGKTGEGGEGLNAGPDSGPNAGPSAGPPVAALVSYEDVYVERAFSEATAKLLGGRARLWVTNEFQHSGLRDDPTVFERLLAMSKGEVAIPS